VTRRSSSVRIVHLADVRCWVVQYLERCRCATGDELVAKLRDGFRADPMEVRTLLDEMVDDAVLVTQIEAVEAEPGRADLRYVTWFLLPTTERARTTVRPHRPPTSGSRAAGRVCDRARTGA
jgi:hypothetical protein